MPNLGLGVSIAHPRASGSSGNIRTLYSDSFIEWPNSGATFRDRQFFSSSSYTNIEYGGGILTQNTGASGRHVFVYFNCDEHLGQYQTYDPNTQYGFGPYVYGGTYGHAVFQKQFPTVRGLPPIFLASAAGGIPSPGTDINGWKRFHPTLLPIEIGKSIIVSFNFKAVSPGDLSTASALRFAILDSSIGGSPYYLNDDNQGLTNAIFGGNGNTPGYRGYMTTLSSTVNVNSHKILTRTTTTNTSLVNSITGVWTQVANQTASNVLLDNNYSVELKVNRTGSSTIVYTGKITGGTLSGGTLSYTDNAPSTFVFDTLALDVVANACAAYQISNVKAIYV